jgi:hypothetical protein
VLTYSNDFLGSLGFKAADADPCLSVLRCDGAIVFVLVCVKDMLVAVSTLEAVEFVKPSVLDKFEARDMGEAALFLGMTVVRRRKDKLLWLRQGRYARHVLERFGMTAAKSMQASMAIEMQLRPGDAASEQTIEPYVKLIGNLMYLMTCRRPDLAQAVGAMLQFVSDPGR